MKKILPILFLLILAGVGCSGGVPKSAKADGGILRTADAGKAWTQNSTVPTAKGIGTLTSANILTMEQDPQDPSMMYITTREDGFLYSDDAGASFYQPRDKALSTGYISSVKVDPKNSCTVYVAKESRLYKSTDCMRSFQNDVYLESRPKISVAKVAVDWYNPQNIWLGLSNGDVQKSLDGGKTWSNSTNVRSEIKDILINQTDSRIILIATSSSGFMKTTDSGATWVDASNSDLRGAQYVFDLIQTNDSGVVIASSKYGLSRSADFGTTWTPIKLVSAPGQLLIRAVGMDVSNPNVLFYATTGTFYRSSDAGATWQTNKIPSIRSPQAMLIDPADHSVVYVGVATEVKQ